MFRKNRMMVDAIHDNFVYGRVSCNCGDPDHDLAFFIEDDEYGVYSLHLDKRIHAYSHHTWLKQAWWRIKTALEVLFTGQTQGYTDFILDETNLDAFEDLIHETQYRITQSKLKKNANN